MAVHEKVLFPDRLAAVGEAFDKAWTFVVHDHFLTDLNEDDKRTLLASALIKLALTSQTEPWELANTAIYVVRRMALKGRNISFTG